MKRTLLFILLLLGAFSLLFAQDYVFERFHLEMDAALDNSYAVQEQIVANFSAERHGIFREIPIRFGDVRVKLKDLQSNEPIKEDSVSSDWVTFRLGSENRTVIGLKEYLIRYTYAIGDDRNEEYDEFYYNLVGTGWQAPIKEMTFRITFPKPVDPSMIFLTGGLYGSTAQRGVFTLGSDGRTIEGRASNLLPGEALTLRVQMEQGYFSEVKPFVDYTVAASLIVWVIALLAGVHSLVLFRRHGREELFVPVVRFDPPDGLSPMEVGYLADGVVDNKDVTSMLFAWADQGCLTIEEQGKKEFLFTKIKVPVTSKSHEKRLFNAFFACGDGSTVTLKQLEKGKFAEALMKAKSDVHAYFKGERRLNDSLAEKKRVIPMLYGGLVVVLNAIASTISYISAETVPFLVIGFFSMGLSILIASRLSSTWVMTTLAKKVFKVFALVVVSIVMFGFAFMFEYAFLAHALLYSVVMGLSVVCLPVYFGFLTIMTAKRSAYAQQKLEQIVGYKEFISKVEMDKLKMMIDSDPQIFYHVLGFAIVLGLEDVWAKKFAKITIEQPSWYVGNRPIRDALFYSSLSHRLHGSVMEKAVYTQAKGGSRSPIHSSFGSSGFSGGGFGGGGGGAW